MRILQENDSFMNFEKKLLKVNRQIVMVSRVFSVDRRKVSKLSGVEIKDS